MWKPPERIKYIATSGQWPTAQQAAGAKLFSPLQVGPMQLAQRTWIPAMVPWRASDDGFVTEDVIQWYERFARGRPGAIVIEATGIRDVPSGPLLRIGHDRFIPGLQELVERVRVASGGETRLLIQLIDFLGIRRRPQPDKYFQRFMPITEPLRRALGGEQWSDQQVRDHMASLPIEQVQALLPQRQFESLTMGYRERVTDTHLNHIRQLPDTLPPLFAAAAVRAKTAGFDGVELHYAHAYTMASFLSATNSRDDGYGGCRENRIRLPLEVYRHVRQQVGAQYPLGCRFLSDECIDGGSVLDDACYFGAQLAAAGMDFLSLSRGGKFDDAKQPKIGEAVYPYTGRSGYECMPHHISDQQGPFGRNVAPVAQIRRAIHKAGLQTPTVVAGGIHNFQQAEQILQGNQAEIVGLARQALADPDWFTKVKNGRGNDVRLCEYSNYCEGLDQKHKQVTCKLWDRIDRDQPGVALSKDGKRRLVAPK
ncbi:MAG: NADH:flavin oxidoreductase [Porticoccaceae bacterium]|nr:NADH:flavin oxidoreductase [Porticoccaceae bacterium]